LILFNLATWAKGNLNFGQVQIVDANEAQQMPDPRHQPITTPAHGPNLSAKQLLNEIVGHM